MLKCQLALILFCLSPFLMLAESGDTTTITAHNATDMTSYGAYDEWVAFPSSDKSFRAVQMTYTLGCASSGCSEWDYTTKVIALDPTGEIDSTRKSHPRFRVSGVDTPSIAVSREPTYQLIYDTARQTVDTVELKPFQILVYAVEGEKVVVKDTFNRWPSNYYRYVLDSNGNRIDSNFVEPDSTWQNQQLTYYQTEPVFEKYELSRVITPYGGYMKTGRQGFDNNWKRRYRFNVTDFRNILRDSLKIRVFYEGYSSGFAATIRFRFTEGQANKQVKSVYNLYQGGFPYESPSKFEKEQMPAKTLNIANGIEQAKIRIIPSGHGFDNNTNCAEFCKKHYNLKVNGNQVARQLIWRNDCGRNATYPQGGTWLLDRANWCPGTRVTIYEHNVTEAIKAGKNSFNVDLEPINWTGEQRPSYNFTVQLITYKEVREQLDAALTTIKAPTTKDAYARQNPVAMAPKVEVKNKGTKPVSELAFAYGADGAVTNNFQWEGNLAPMEQRTIQFPAKIKDWRTQGQSPFRVKITKVNGGKDGITINNAKATPFNSPPILPKAFVIWLTTNNQAQQNSLYIVRANGDTVFQRTDLEPNTRYRDSVQLPDKMAEYQLILDDDVPDQQSPADENGLFYPFLQRFGQGNFALRQPGRVGRLIKQFNPDFGSRITYHFATGRGFFVGNNQPSSTDAPFTVRPNPTDGQLTVETGMNVEKWRVVDQLGRVVHRQKGSRGGSHRLNLSHLEPGIYFLQAWDAGNVVKRKVLVD